MISYTEDTDMQTATLPWMQRVPLQFADEIRMLMYGPTSHDLPFAIELAEFRKTDYPGTMSAMAYESDVLYTLPGDDPVAATILMNRPLEHEGWKVYQSGFLGDTVSIFQVTHDPGLVPTYVACTALCVGIVITFDSRSMSHGHPGIRAPIVRNKLAGDGCHEAVARCSRSLPVVAARGCSKP